MNTFHSLNNTKIKNITNIVFVVCFALLTNQSFAQYCTDDERFSEIEVFTNNEIETTLNAVYGSAINWEGDAESLEIDFYLPSLDIDPLSSRPFILLIHGGGFTIGDKSSYAFECRALARRGYVVASMNYRLGYDQSNSSNLVNALYRAQQDVNAALRYVIEIAPILGIDTSWIFIGGGSAGSISSLFTTYMDQDDWNFLFPGIESNLGSINTSGNDFTHTFEINGLLNQWGSGPDIAMTPSELKPMVSFHGALDQVVPIGEGGFGTIGSQLIHERLIDNGICSDFTLDPQGNHVVYNTLEGRTFMMNRTSCFFKSLFCDSCSDFFSTEMVEPNCSGILNTNDLDELNETTVFPNPFKNQLNFSSLNGNEYFLMYDVHGHLIYEGLNIHLQDFQKLSRGMYLIKMQDENHTQSFKLIKE
ncbi:MAG: carboxylesterase family protein [Flavobacteriaceae bacterium]|nr:carboxylesterase family protein [Flavobacteriaceae bacterium]